MDSELEVVYKAHADTVEQIVRHLKSKKCKPVVLDDPSMIVQHTAKGHAKIRVAVPTGQAKKAREALVELELSKSEGVEAMDRLIKRDLLRFVGIYVVIAAILHWIYQDIETTICWGAFVSLVLALIWSNWGRIMQSFKRK